MRDLVMAGQRELMRIIRETIKEDEVDSQLTTLEGPGFLVSGAYLFSGDSVYAAQDIAGGLIVRDPNGGDRTDTTDDADAIIEECGLTEDGMYRDCLMFNDADAAETVTLAGGSGVTVANPEQQVEQKRVSTLTFLRTGAANVILYVRGGS